MEYWVVIFFNEVAFLIKNYKIIYNWYIFYHLLQVLLQTDEWHTSHYVFKFAKKILDSPISSYDPSTSSSFPAILPTMVAATAALPLP